MLVRKALDATRNTNSAERHALSAYTKALCERISGAFDVAKRKKRLALAHPRDTGHREVRSLLKSEHLVDNLI
jgi:hypothetical protein